MTWRRRDIIVVAFLIFNSVVNVFSLLFGDRMWLLLEGAGISKVLFQSYMILVGVCALLSLVIVLTFILRRNKVDELKVPVIPTDASNKSAPVKKVARDEDRRLRIYDEVEKNKQELARELENEKFEEERAQRRPVQPVVIDRNTYYDNGYMDEFGVFHEYEGGN